MLRSNTLLALLTLILWGNTCSRPQPQIDEFNTMLAASGEHYGLRIILEKLRWDGRGLEVACAIERSRLSIGLGKAFAMIRCRFLDVNKQEVKEDVLVVPLPDQFFLGQTPLVRTQQLFEVPFRARYIKLQIGRSLLQTGEVPIPTVPLHHFHWEEKQACFGSSRVLFKFVDGSRSSFRPFLVRVKRLSTRSCISTLSLCPRCSPLTP